MSTPTTRSTKRSSGDGCVGAVEKETKTLGSAAVFKKVTRSAVGSSVDGKDVTVSKSAAKQKHGGQVSSRVRSARSSKQTDKVDSEGEQGEKPAVLPSDSLRRKSPVRATPGPSEHVPADAEVTQESKSVPVTPVRRSSRAPVPSSRFKDMVTRRKSGASEGTDTESDSEPARKRAKKNSVSSETTHLIADTASSESLGPIGDEIVSGPAEVHSDRVPAVAAPLQQTELSIPSQEAVQEVSLKEGEMTESQNTKTDTLSTVVDVPNLENAEFIDQNTESAKVTEPNTCNAMVEVRNTQDAKAEGLNTQRTEVENSNIQSTEVENLNIQSAAGEEQNTQSANSQPADVPSISGSQEVVTEVADSQGPVETGDGLAEAMEETVVEEVVVETVELAGKSRSLLEQHLHGAVPPRASSAMEGSYALIEEKDLVAVQSAIGQEDPGMSRDIQQALSGLSGIDTSSKHITLTERDGQTVAIITIAPPGPAAATPSTETMHGHIVEKPAGLANVITGSSPAYINVAVEPTSISHVLPDKPAKLSAKPSPAARPGKNFGGRVLKPDGSHSGTFIKTLGVSQVVPVATPPPRQTYSLLSGEENTPGQTVPIQGSPQKVVIVGQQPPAPAPSALSQALQGTLPADSVSPASALSQALQGTLPPDSVSPASKAMLGSHTKVLDQSKGADGVQQKISTLGLPPAVANLLLHKLKEQPGRVIIKESINSSKLIQSSKASSSQLVGKAGSNLSEKVSSTTSPSEGSTSDPANTGPAGQGTQELDVDGKASASVSEVVLSSQSTDNSTTESGDKADAGTDQGEGDKVELNSVGGQTGENSFDEKRVENASNRTTKIEKNSNERTQDGEVSGDTTMKGEEESLGEQAVETVVEFRESSGGSVIEGEESQDGKMEENQDGKMDESQDGKREESQDGQMGVEEENADEKAEMHVMENGVQYKVKILSDEVSASSSQGAVKADEEGMVIIKQELSDGEVHEESISLQNLFDGKHTAGTQTAYSAKEGDSVKKQIFTASDGPIHKLATVVSEEGQRRQYYYVSVMLNKDYDGKGTPIGGRGSSSTHCVVNEEGMYCCGKCSYKTDRKANFYKHRRLHTGSKPHTCQVCNYRAGTSSNLKRHMGIHEDIRQHRCDMCGLCFRQKIHLERHIKYKHEEKRVQCPLCSYVCANEQPDLRMHMKRKHSSEAPGGQVCVCPTCQATFPSKRDLKQHLKFHRDGPELKLFCKECSFVTDCQSRLKRHAAIHEKVKPFMCSLCQYRAAQKEHVLRHLRTQHKIEVKRQHKRAWKRRSLPDKPVETSEVPKTSKEKADFSSGDKIFACNHCTMRFAKLINLYKHLHTQHSDIMPAETEGNYYCVVCEFFTHTKKALLIHMRRHNITDQTPPTHVFSCVLCRYVTPRRRNLFQHMRKKHSIDISQQDELDDDNPQEPSELKSEPQDPTPGGKVVCDDLVGMANMIKIEDLTRVGAIESSDLDPSKLVIDTRTSRADAAEGLQALAQQVVCETDLTTEPAISVESETVITSPVVSGEVAVSEAVVSEAVINEAVVADAAITDPGVSDAVVSNVVVNESVAQESVELTEDQLASLQSGDLVEMDGQLYLVELTPDPSGPDRQLLSFLPVNSEA